MDDFTTAEGEAFACEMLAFIPNVEIEINYFIMWTNERTVGPEKPDADFASKCNWVFGFIKGVQMHDSYHRPTIHRRVKSFIKDRTFYSFLTIKLYCANWIQ